MDFDAAARRLERDQSKLRSRNKKPMVVSAKAKREAEYRKQQQWKRQQERSERTRRARFLENTKEALERTLAVKGLTGNPLSATSIHGDGDKIALPPSVLEFLTANGILFESQENPWTFRIGILNPEYKFPSSEAFRELKDAEELKSGEFDDDEDDDEYDLHVKQAYREELSHKYLAYTHGTVVEFTQEEGHVGLPSAIAKALLCDGVPAMRTADPSAGSAEEPMETDNDDDEKTPGHLAWGAFDLPALPLEISMLSLPKGKACTLVPTEQAIRNGFYNLQDVKLVLEQSLIRTRATLSVGDTVHTWHRGVQFDLTVEGVTPSSFGAVTCINTDLEVIFGENKAVTKQLADEKDKNKTSNTAPATSDAASSGGQVLGRTLSSPSPSAQNPATQTTAAPMELLPEPPADQTRDICTIQIRSSSGTGRRRFDIAKATLTDLFCFAATVLETRDLLSFRLLANFPRRIFTIATDNADAPLSQHGIAPGQEMFMAENNIC